MLLSRGLTMRQMANRLGISPRTVETHVAKLYRKLDVRTRVQAVSRAVSLGLDRAPLTDRPSAVPAAPSHHDSVFGPERPIGQA